MPFSRLLLTGLACTLGLLVGLSPARAIEPKYLPPDTEVVITVNVQQILNSEAAKANKELVEQAKTMLEDQLVQQGVQRYFKKAGFDPFRDLKSITAIGPGARDADAGFIIIEGKFNPEKVNAAIEEAGQEAGEKVKPLTIGDVKAYEITPEGEKTVYAGLIGKDKLVATASKDAFTEAVNRITAGKAATLKKEMKALIETASPKQSLVIVATGPALARMIENAPIPQADAAGAGLKDIEGMRISIAIERNINFEFAINAKDQMTAEQFAKTGTGALVMVRALVKQRAEEDPNVAPAVDVVNSMRLTSKGNNVLLRGEITYEALGKMLENLPQR